MNRKDKTMYSRVAARIAAYAQRSIRTNPCGHPGTLLVKQDRLKGWGYLEQLGSMKGNANLSAADQSRIAVAGHLLGKLKCRINNEINEASEKTKANRFYLSVIELNKLL